MTRHGGQDSRPLRGLELSPVPQTEFDYHLDESDADIVVLRHQDGSFVVAYGARGITEGNFEAAKEDYIESLMHFLVRQGEDTEQRHSA